jgi:hypothetical protein
MRIFGMNIPRPDVAFIFHSKVNKDAERRGCSRDEIRSRGRACLIFQCRGLPLGAVYPYSSFVKFFTVKLYIYQPLYKDKAFLKFCRIHFLSLLAF